MIRLVYNIWKLEEFKKNWGMCFNCGACYYRGPIVPHNWKKLPPHDWASPIEKCPIFEYYKFRTYSAYGLGLLAHLVFQKDLLISDNLIKIAYTCTSCGICNEICGLFTPLYSTWALREEIINQGFLPPEPLKHIYENIEKCGNIFGIEKPSKIMENLPKNGDDIYFAGCYSHRMPNIAIALIKILKMAGHNISHLGSKENCCGFIGKYSGNIDMFKKMASKNVSVIKELGSKRVIFSCPHGYHLWKFEYPKVVGELPFKVIHVVELISDLINEGSIIFNKKIDKIVTYHDPCFLGRHSGIYREPRNILKRIPGIKLVEMERYGKWAYCCGAGAKITLNCYPEFATAIAKDRLLEAQKVSKIIVSSCPICIYHLNKTAKEENISLNIIDLLLLVAEAMGIQLKNESL